MSNATSAGTELRRAWRSLWQLHPRRDEPVHVPLRARLTVVSLLALGLTLGLMTIAALFGHVDRPGWWWASLLPTVGISLCILHTLFGVLWVAERRLPAPLVERMSELRDLRAALVLGALAAGGIVLGIVVGFSAIPALAGFDLWASFASPPVALAKMSAFMLCLLAANWAWWRTRLRQHALRAEAMEARLRLLQGQIEPHLMFNVLANVQSLMDYDPPRAKRMLETFSAYLRAGLSQLREIDSTLGAELEMTHNYLALMQIRMEERLVFRIEAGPDARAAPMPALMLQPLVENAIHHGLEPKLAGGCIVVEADVRGGRLVIRVRDDGMGLDVPSRRLRPGAGIALANLRARLQTRFGDDAALTLGPGTGAGAGADADADADADQTRGTDAVLDLPYRPAPAAIGKDGRCAP